MQTLFAAFEHLSCWLFLLSGVFAASLKTAALFIFFSETFLQQESQRLFTQRTIFIPRKRIRGMYPPSGLKAWSFGSSSSCSDSRNIYTPTAWSVSTVWSYIHNKLIKLSLLLLIFISLFETEKNIFYTFFPPVSNNFPILHFFGFKLLSKCFFFISEFQHQHFFNFKCFSTSNFSQLQIMEDRKLSYMLFYFQILIFSFIN